LWIRNLDSLTPHSVAGTDGTISPFWAPDSRSLAFFAEGKLKRLDISSGTIQVLCDAPNGRGGSWNSEDTIIFAPNVGDRIYRVSASGGTPVAVTQLDLSKDEWSHRYPSFLPDGRHFLYLARSPQAVSNGIFLASLDGGSPRRLLDNEGALQPTYASGYVLYSQGNGTLFAQEFDLKRLRPTGNPRLIAERIAVSEGYGYAAYSVSANGVLAYSRATVPETRLMWVNRNGRREGQVGALGGYASVTLSPDGKRVAVDPFDPQLDTRDIVLIDSATGAQRKLTFTTKNEFFPLWSSDGKNVIYAAEGGGGLPDLFVKAASGAGDQQPVIAGRGAKFPTDWSRDGKYVLYHGSGATTGWDVYLYSTADHTSKPLIQTPANEEQAQFSPDGRWVVYTSDETGNLEVYVRGFSANGGTWRVSAAGGSQPRWRQDGKELFYVAPDSRLMSVPINSGDVFEAGTPRALFETSLPLSISPHPLQYAVAPDGQRFLVNLPAETVTARPLTLVLNWPAEVKQ
jgi:Tol biopolymer transport system component